MKVVEKAECLPRRCAVSNNERGPFVDFGVDLGPSGPNQRNRLYLRVPVVEEAARKLGMVPKGEVDRLLEQLNAITTELKELREVMNLYGELEEKVSAIRSRRGA